MSDSDVTAYAANVATAGGVLPTNHFNALDANIAALKASGAWALIKELWLPLGSDGDLTTSAIKFKPGTTTNAITFHNFISTDYTVALGFNQGSTAAAKSVLTDFAPKTATLNGALTNSEYGFGAYLTKQYTDLTAIIMGGSGGFDVFMGYNKGNTTIAGVDVIYNSTRVKRYQIAQQSAGVASMYIGGYQIGTSTNASPAAFFNGGMSLGAGGGDLYGDGALGGYTIHAPMTAAQLRATQTFFDNVSQAIGRSIFSTALTGFGDSYVANPPTGPSDNAHDWVALAGTSKGWGYNLLGVGGRAWTDFDTLDHTFTQLGPLLNAPSTHIVIPMGINDATVSSDGTGVTTGTHNVLNMLAAIGGFPLSSLMLGTTYWSPAIGGNYPVGFEAVRSATIAVANDPTYAGILLVDFAHGRTYNQPSYQTASLHQNDAGHVQLSLDFLDVAWSDGISFSAAQVSYSLTDESVNLLVSRKVTATQASFSFSPENVNMSLSGSIDFVVDKASFVLSPIAAALRHIVPVVYSLDRTYSIPAESRSLSVGIENRTFGVTNV